MPYSTIETTYTGTNLFSVNFTLGYLDRDHVTARVNDEVDGGGSPVYRTITWVTDGTVSLSGTLTNGDTVKLTRTTPTDVVTHDYEDGEILTEANIDESFLQCIMIAHEALDGRFGTLQQDLNMGANKIVNMADAEDAQDAVTLAQLEDYTGNAPAYAAAAAASAAAAATSETNASTSETNAATSETNAAASADAAANALSGVQWAEVMKITTADSPYTVTDDMGGTLLVVDSSSGAVDIALPQIASAGEPFSLGVKKSSSDSNDITVSPYSDDTIDGAASAVIVSDAGGGYTFAADDTVSTDDWVSVSFGLRTGNMVVDTYVDGIDFTAGTTTGLTTTASAGSDNNMLVFFDGIVQHHTEFSVSGTTVTFASAIPLGVSAVELRYGTTLSIGEPADTSITYAKLSSGLVGDTTDIQNSEADKVPTCDAVKSAITADIAANQGVAKAWVTFNGTGTVAINDSYNVSSITDNGTGDYTVNFTTAFANANFATTWAFDDVTGVTAAVGLLATSTVSSQRFVTVRNDTGAAADIPRLCLAFFGGQ